LEESILTSTKKLLGIASSYTAFDVDIITHINSVFSVLNQLGIGEADFVVEDSEAKWADFIGDAEGMNLVRSYVFLKVRLLFDPPPTSFGIEAMNNQIKECEWRLSSQREWNRNPVDPRAVEEV
jgi:hypothetical protein